MGRRERNRTVRVEMNLLSRFWARVQLMADTVEEVVEHTSCKSREAPEGTQERSCNKKETPRESTVENKKICPSGSQHKRWADGWLFDGVGKVDYAATT
jgi:hypothetical protein